MQRRLALSVALAAALGSTLSARGAESLVWIVLSDSGGAYAEAAALIKSESGHLDMWVGPVRDVPADVPRAVVVLGGGALRWATGKIQADPAWSRVPVLAALLPRASFDAIVPHKALPNVSAVVLDQPVERYFELLRQAMPLRRRVGVLLGQDTQHLKPVLTKAATARGMSLSTASVQDADLYTALQSVLNESDVLLVLPDGSLFETGALQNMLITAYRRRIPVLTYSAAHVRAGATLALHTTPTQAARQAVGALRELLRGGAIAPVRPSVLFSVAINTTVGHSLGLSLDASDVLEDAVRRQEGTK
jgi:putative tryptophan/tyrosine transport system substrate-binding protein